jgi:hypothetical protein
MGLNKKSTKGRPPAMPSHEEQQAFLNALVRRGVQPRWVPRAILSLWWFWVFGGPATGTCHQEVLPGFSK